MKYVFDIEALSPEQLAKFANSGSQAIGIEAPKIIPAAQKLHIAGRRWFQKAWGSTYHSVYVYINGMEVFRVPFEYGYGDCYLQTAVDGLKALGLLPENAGYGTYYLREESGYDFSYEVQDVQRKRDL